MVTPESATAACADVIIAALGARAAVPDIPGVDGENVLGAEEAYYFPEKTGESVLILGGGLVGIELGIYLGGLGRVVTIMEMMETLSDGGNPVHALALISEIERHGIQVSTSTRAIEISGHGAIGEYVGSAYTLPECPTVQEAVLQSNSFGRALRADAEVGSRKLFGADTVVYATGRRPLHAEADALRFCAPEFHQIGDCLAPKNIREAVRMAFSVARDV
jgi:NADPH-dependent 2,4-dienoyl-CoA reductase/sulfur reductase-like enzyme